MKLWDYKENKGSSQYYLRVTRKGREQRSPLKFIQTSDNGDVTYYNLFCREGVNGARKVRITNAI